MIAALRNPLYPPNLAFTPMGRVTDTMSATTETELIAERESGILTLTFNRPRTLNSLTPAVLDSLRSAVEEAAADDEVRCVVLTGTGRAFGSGASLQQDGGAFDPERVLTQHYNPAILAMQKLEKPLLASINGPAMGASASLALACDFRIMADTARMALLFTRIGLAPDAGASYILPRLIGVTRALEMMMLGDDVGAEQALEWGLVNRVVPAADLEAETRAFAERLAALPAPPGWSSASCARP